MPPTHVWRTLLAQDVAKDRLLEAQRMALTFATGIQDAATFTTYHVFPTKQTGNTFFLALYAFNPGLLGPRAAQNILVSIVSFFLGGAFHSHFAQRRGQRCRGWLLATNLFQTLLVLGAAVFCYRSVPETYGGGSAALGTIALLSFASSGQIAMSTGVGLPELNTTMITGALVQLSNDPRLFRFHNPARTRRLLLYLSFFTG
ncbi:hypothetical protein B0A55_12592 [Friedmanniomyces simplex]|uniref:DUF1275 domain protein n=1 Tax=Friedmanniomyces simplex TaxID=329884 RepID=A0A4U0W4J5_9PEZI|nr:hypothetical protein B0A55_12592 [Friedmanniomyces simplex]